MKEIQYGSIEFTDEDRNYNGSRYSEVRNAIFANPYQKVWGAEDVPPLPMYEVSLGSVLGGILPFGKPWRFLQAVRKDGRFRC